MNPMPRVLRIAGSLAIMLVAYGAYALLAVPFIEPAADPGRAQKMSALEKEAARRQLDLRVAALRPLFPPDAWELKNPKILESENVKLLMQNYRNLGGGRVELYPCTVIFNPNPAVTDPQQGNGQAVVLQVPQGAMLEFDGPLDLAAAKIGRLVGGRLRGPITIRSNGKKPGNEDDLQITTRDVELTEQHVWTPHEVDFHLGPHYGRGRRMHIKLLGGKKPLGAGHRGPNIAGIEFFEVRHVERLHLELGRLQLPGPPKPGKTNKVNKANKPPQAASDMPLEITCRGPFRFDAPAKMATFEDRVDVMRLHPVGPADQLNCELLSVYFSDRRRGSSAGKPSPKRGSKKPQESGPLDLEPQRLEARGNPVALFAPGEKLQARGERLEYDLHAKRIVLDGDAQVMLRQGPNEIYAKSLHYQSAGPGRLGQITAQGPGWLKGQIANRPDGQLQARWKQILRVYPHEKNQVVSLTGSAGLNYSGIGQLNAEQIHFWLVESPPQGDSDQRRLRPDRMLAKENVQLHSSRLSGAVEQLQVWFEQPDGQGQREKAEGGRGKEETAPTAQRPTVTADTPPPPADRPETTARQQHFQITGRLLQARLMLRDDRQTGLLELTVEDGVKLLETQTAEPQQQPLSLSGERVHVLDADKPHAALTVTGRPAHFEGRGLALTGPNINLNRGTNRLWIDGAGQMNLPVRRDLEGRPLKNPGSLSIQWRGRMAFDGRRAEFDDAVAAATATEYLQTDTLEVRFLRPVRFTESNSEQQPEVEQILCRGGVLMEGRTFDGRELLSLEKMQLVDLAMNLQSGAMNAGGPGWVNSVRRGSGDPTDALANRRPAGMQDPSLGEKDPRQLRCLHVEFQGSITGNLHAREMTFHDRVRTAYAPVQSWQAMLDPDQPDRLPPDGVVMHCDRLSAVQMAMPTGEGRAMEFVADGNTVVESSTFTARAIRITYAEAKDLLVLEGDGRSDAELFRQQWIGGPTSRAAAEKIFYWPKTNRLKVAGARSLELENFSFGDPEKP